jgi:hypothetical protein
MSSLQLRKSKTGTKNESWRDNIRKCKVELNKNA